MTLEDECADDCGAWMPSMEPSQCGTAGGGGGRLRVRRPCDEPEAKQDCFKLQTPCAEPIGDHVDGGSGGGGYDSDDSDGKRTNPTDYYDSSDNKKKEHDFTIRRIHVSKTFSFRQACADSAVAVFKVDGDIFKKRANIDGKRSDKRMGNLSSCLLHSARIIGYANNFPTSMSAQISGVSGNSYTAGGIRAALVMLRDGHSSIASEYMVHIPLMVLRTRKMAYAGIQTTNIMDGVYQMDKGHYSVPPNHIIIDVMYQLEGSLDFNPDECRMPKGNYCLSTDYLLDLVKYINESIINHIPYQNLGKLSINFQRADVAPGPGSWENPHGEFGMYAHNDEYALDMKTNQFNVSILVEIKYLMTSME